MHHRTAQFAFNLYPRSELGYYECGRDLFTFVSVASTHIMRTLQKPKKSRPTKRKVNHRRFLQNQIYRKYSVIEAATQQLATSIFSQEAVVEKPNPTHKNENCSAIQNRRISLKEIRKEKIPPLQDVINLSSDLSMLPDEHLDSSTFLGVAEAYLVPDTISKSGISMDTLASDEVGTVESLFDNIQIEDDIFASPYGLIHPTPHQLHKKAGKEHEYETTLDTGLILGGINNHGWPPESFGKMGHHLPFLQITADPMENRSSDLSWSNPPSDPEIMLHEVVTPVDIYNLHNIKGSPKNKSEIVYKMPQTDYEYDQDIDFLSKGEHYALTDDVLLDKELDLQPGPTNDNENVDYSVFCASTNEPNTINIYRALCLNNEENSNFLCSSW